jgi:hypothetical protein
MLTECIVVVPFGIGSMVNSYRHMSVSVQYTIVASPKCTRAMEIFIIENKNKRVEKERKRNSQALRRNLRELNGHNANF